ncbi:MAG: twin-arginine translocase TatA/TatE family subunit [Bacteriovoracaceae bacterium]|nr:twin-arginine translocase TatA/TatE family subunit [Bacteriovoracaceae bacterium]
MFGLGFGEILIIGVVVLLFFGGKRLPGLGRSLGESIGEFKKGLKQGEDKDDSKK